jgi:hypothetical protein
MPRYSNSVVYSTCGASAQSRLLLILFALPLRSLWHLLSYSVLMEHAHTHTTVLTLQVHHVSGQQGRLHHGDPRLREEDTEADDGVQVPQPAHQHRGNAQAAHRQVTIFFACGVSGVVHLVGVLCLSGRGIFCFYPAVVVACCRSFGLGSMDPQRQRRNRVH